MFLKCEVLKDIGLFDENIFMYLEDTDLNRRIHSKYKTIFYPKPIPELTAKYHHRFVTHLLQYLMK